MSEELNIALPAGPARVVVTGEGAPLLWTHGLFHPTEVEDRTVFGQVLAALRRRRIVRFDTRGYGTEVPPPDGETYAWHRLGEDVLALADALRIDTFTAAGFSMGVAATLHAAVRAPERVKALVLLAPPNGWELRPAQAREFLDSVRQLREEGLEALIDVFARFLEQRPNPPGMTGAQEAMLERLRRLSPGALEGILLGAAASDLPSKVAVRKLEMPALVFAFDNDPGHPVPVAHALAETLPNAQLRTLRHLDDAGAIRLEVQAFLDQLG